MAAGNDVGAEKNKSLRPGAVIRCKTTFGDQFEGEVISYYENSKAITIKSIPTGKRQSKSHWDVSIINLSQVDQSNFELVSLPKGEAVSLPDVDMEIIKQRLKLAKERVGIGVSEEGQNLFDFIYKTINQCVWKGHSICVLDEVTIAPPYKLDDCTGNGNDQSLNYIKSIVRKYYGDESSTPSSSSSCYTTAGSSGILT